MIRSKFAREKSPFVFGEITDPVELARSRQQDARFQRNLTWFEAHALELGEKHRGKCICIAGEELFVGDAPKEVLARARAAHPEDDGVFLHYIYKEKRARIYAH